MEKSEIKVNGATDLSKREELIKEKVAELKKKHGIKEMFVIEAEDKIAYVKRPSRDQLKYAMSISQNDPLGLAEQVLESGWLDGDEEIKTEDKYFLAVSAQVDALIETTTATIKKY